MKNWKDNLKEVLENHDGVFGHNTEVDIKSFLSKIEKLSENHSQIEILDYYSVRITLPSASENVLLHILCNAPMPNECKFNKKKRQLTLEWHY